MKAAFLLFLPWLLHLHFQSSASIAAGRGCMFFRCECHKNLMPQPLHAALARLAMHETINTASKPY